MSNKNVVLGVCGSPRARFQDTKAAIGLIKNIENYQDLYATIYDLASHKKISNSEALMWMALFGAAKEGADVDIVLLGEIYCKRNTQPFKTKGVLEDKVQRAEGIVLATPVYFGDCSSLTNLFLENHFLKDKVIGVVSVGAKRNGGQETANIFTLMEAMSLGSIIVGNGPPTSQYGGTGWAGDVGAILDDNFGLDTSLGTGKRVMEVIKRTQMKQASVAQITVITNSTANDDSMIEGIKSEFLKLNQVKTSFINLSEYDISSCNACSICPKPREQNIKYGCIIEDDMKKIDDEILRSDGLAFVIDETPQNKSFWSTFK
ncbi:MAG: NAD(P)H-dependent oxidoreductase, partial [Thermodesulfobacteriota bacterium]|nr:NAD(P)H-dependent oxidoreductase [Thermodesulfobacteriota bacterium]